MIREIGPKLTREDASSVWEYAALQFPKEPSEQDFLIAHGLDGYAHERVVFAEFQA